MSTTDLDSFMRDLVEHDSRTRGEFASLFPNNLHLHPIPFFGDIRSARVITVGVNPSSTEFSPDRDWPVRINPDALAERLFKYFSGNFAPPHAWFAPWDIALSLLGCNYLSGSAAHLDLSYRATYSMRQLDQMCLNDLFLSMLLRDLEWFYKVLPFCEKVKLICITGTVTKRYFINEFLKEFSQQYKFELKRDFIRGGRGPIAYHKLVGHELSLPIFFCGSSPSSRDHGKLLIQRVEENQKTLRSVIEGDPNVPDF